MLLLGDIALLYGALFLTLLIRYGSFPTQVLWQDHNLPFLFVNLVWLIIFYIAGLYDVENRFTRPRFFTLQKQWPSARESPF